MILQKPSPTAKEHLKMQFLTNLFNSHFLLSNMFLILSKSQCLIWPGPENSWSYYSHTLHSTSFITDNSPGWKERIILGVVFALSSQFTKWSYTTTSNWQDAYVRSLHHTSVYTVQLFFFYIPLSKPHSLILRDASYFKMLPFARWLL